MLIQRRAAIDICHKLGTTPLHRALQTDNSQVVRLLLKHGADVNAHSESGKTFAWFTLLSSFQSSTETVTDLEIQANGEQIEKHRHSSQHDFRCGSCVFMIK